MRYSFKLPTKLYAISIIAVATMLSPHIANADLPGKWLVSVDLGELGKGDSAITFSTGDNGKLTGTYVGQLDEDGSIDGTYNGNEFQFVVDGQVGLIVFKGELSDDDTVNGVLESRGQSLGSFVGKKSE